MRTKNFIYNSIAFAMLQVITLLTGFLMPRLYITTYGSDINGLVSSIVQFISYFSYVEAGLGTALIYALFKPLADHDIDGINGIVSLARESYINTSKLHFLLVVSLSVIYPFIIKDENIGSTTMVLLVLVIGIFGTLDFYTMAKYRVLLTADQREYVISAVSTVALIINFVFMVLLINIGTSIVIVRIVPVFSLIIRSALFYLYIKHKYAFIKYNQPYETLCLTRRYDALVSQLSANLYHPVPLVVVSIFCSLKMASVYSVYCIIFEGLIGIISIFTAGVSASFGNVVAKGEINVLEQVHTQFEFSIYAITSVLYSCTIILIDPFIRIYTNGITDINYVNPIYSVLFVIWGILHNIRIPYTALENAAGLYRETRRVNILQTVLLIVLSISLVQFFDIIGVLTALIIATLYRVIGLIVVTRHLFIKESPIKTFLRALRMFVVVILSYIPFQYWIHIRVSNLYGWLIWAVGVSVWCCVVALLLNYILDRRVFRETIFRLRSLFNRREKLDAR